MICVDGIVYRIWAVGGILLFLGIFSIILACPWKKEFKIKNHIFELFATIFSAILLLGYTYFSINPTVSIYEGEFVESRRDSRVAPPIPATYAYVFLNEEPPKQIFYLDTFSKKKIFPYEFEEGKEYRIYYEERTDIILAVEEIEG